MKTFLTTFVFAVSLISLSGCSGGDPLNGTRWTLDAANTEGQTITAEFFNGQIAGNSGVNSYSGSYKVGSSNSFSVGQLAGTLMAGPEPAMRAESAYLKLLGEAKSYQLADGKLMLYDGKGNKSASFTAAGK